MDQAFAIVISGALLYGFYVMAEKVEKNLEKERQEELKEKERQFKLKNGFSKEEKIEEILTNLIFEHKKINSSYYNSSHYKRLSLERHLKETEQLREKYRSLAEEIFYDNFDPEGIKARKQREKRAATKAGIATAILFPFAIAQLILPYLGIGPGGGWKNR